MECLKQTVPDYMDISYRVRLLTKHLPTLIRFPGTGKCRCPVIHDTAVRRISIIHHSFSAFSCQSGQMSLIEGIAAGIFCAKLQIIPITMKYTDIVFDIDGTLVDNVKEVLATWTANPPGIVRQRICNGRTGFRSRHTRRNIHAEIRSGGSWGSIQGLG